MDLSTVIPVGLGVLLTRGPDSVTFSSAPGPTSIDRRCFCKIDSAKKEFDLLQEHPNCFRFRQQPRHA